MIKNVKDVLVDDFWIMPATPEYLNEGIPYITSKNIKNGSISFNNVNYISQEAYEVISKNRPILCGDILISMIGTLGETAEVSAEDGVFYGQNMFLVRLDENQINKRYFLNYFNSSFVKRALAGSQNQSTQRYLKANHIEDLQIPVPEIFVQERIANRLDTLSGIIEHRKSELALMDDLIKARFVELFGNIKTNDFGWEKCTFKDVSTKITDGEHGTVPRVDEGEGYLYLMARNITKEGEIDLSETSFVPAEVHEKIFKRCNPEKNDLLLVCVGATIGKCALVPETMEAFSMARSVALIKPNKDKVTSSFLINLLRSESIQNDIDQCSHAAAQAGLYTNMINGLDAFVPPMKLQMEFDTFCKQVDKSKVVVQKALDEAQLLFDSLMQEYFG